MHISTLALPETMIDARDRYLGPCLLSPFAEDLACRLARLNTGPLLEIAADTGILTLAIASSVSAGMTIIATDPDPVAIKAARAKGGLARVTWQNADPANLPFQDGKFGIIACQFALATMTDRRQAMREARRVMVPGGRFIFTVPGSLRFNPVAACVQDAMDALFPNDPPRFLQHGLHGYADDEAIDEDLTAAGFTDAMYTNVELTFAGTAAETALGYCLGTPLRYELRAGSRPDSAIDAVASALRRRFRTDSIRTGMRALIVSASA